ncbi:hypothetical protein EVAR_18315_1 [Eumeta japonica]|uniref:Uncharacterized protein n=1 Tax=Eumeta variegata TaxID=151549 RepID=A0A4C1V9H6_EUMVA|nr:hypothetical protein EVAR_18315_1 [Eumeta japonica]
MIYHRRCSPSATISWSSRKGFITALDTSNTLVTLVGARMFMDDGISYIKILVEHKVARRPGGLRRAETRIKRETLYFISQQIIGLNVVRAGNKLSNNKSYKSAPRRRNPKTLPAIRQEMALQWVLTVITAALWFESGDYDRGREYWGL